MEHKFIFDEDKLQWQCACGNSIEDMDFRMTYYHSLEVFDNTERSFETTDWTTTSSLHCKCGNLYVNPDHYELRCNEDGFVGIILLDIDEKVS